MAHFLATEDVKTEAVKHKGHRQNYVLMAVESVQAS